MYNSIADEEFADNVASDIKHFVKGIHAGPTNTKSVLLFPPVNNYRRFLIHKICDETSVENLHHFSIGQGCDRRTVVCFTKDLISTLDKPSMGIDQYHLPSIPPVRHEEDKKWKVMAAIDIYRPPAVRRLLAQQAQATTTEPQKPRTKPRRPDIQVYVPRPKRLSAGGSESSPSSTRTATPPAPCRKPSSANSVAAGSTSKQTGSCSDTITNSSSSYNKHVIAMSDVGQKSKSFNDNCREECHSVEAKQENDSEVSKYLAPSVSDTGPEGSRSERNVDSSCNKVSLNTRSPALLNHNVETVLKNIVSANQENYLDNNASIINQSDNYNETVNMDITTDIVDSVLLKSNNTNHQCRDVIDETSSDSNFESEIMESNNRKKIEDGSKHYEEPNRKNRLILHGKVMSDVLVISDPEPGQDLTPLASESPSNVSLPKTDVCESKRKPVKKNEEVKSSNVDVSNLNPEECTWDMMFDENGDCLNPQLMEELTSKVGKVNIKTPRCDYKAFTYTEVQHQDEYSHVLEIYNFSSELKTQDLVNIFSPYKDKGFEIKWVDDTHALGVFSSSIVAADVLKTEHPFVKTRPLQEATAESRVKARRSAEFLRPYRARPETCPALARRLVTGALGVKLKTAKQEREAEKALLSQAREKRRLEARLKEDAWEGTMGGN